MGFNGLGVDSPYPFPKYEGDMPYLIDEVGGIKWVETKDKSNTDIPGATVRLLQLKKNSCNVLNRR